jgi:translocator protein
MNKTNKKNLIIIPAILAPLIVGFLGSLLTTPAIDGWYKIINKPSFNPPNWIFSPVWTLLFILMGISLFLILKKPKSHYRKKAIIVFSLQLALNLFWSFLFFFLKSPNLAFLEIIILWFFILATILYFWRLSRLAAYLLIPYLSWVSFASILNYYIWRLN